MKASDLMIGNYFNSNGNIDVVTPNEIEALFESENREWIKPIPLTEEWLVKFGFEWQPKKETYRIEYNIKKHGVKKGKAISIHAFKDEDVWVITLFEVVFIDDVTPTVLKYLHELQNLYYCLTGEQLKIK